MRRRMMRGVIALGVTILFLRILSPYVYAEAPAREETLLGEIQSLEALRENDPQAYHQAIRQKRDGLRQTLRGLREKQPGTFEAFRQREMESRRSRLENFRMRHPETFQRSRAQRMRRFGGGGRPGLSAGLRPRMRPGASRARDLERQGE